MLIGRPNDTLSGGGGTNTFVFNPNFGKDTIKDFNVNQDTLAFAQTVAPTDAGADSYSAVCMMVGSVKVNVVPISS